MVLLKSLYNCNALFDKSIVCNTGHIDVCLDWLCSLAKQQNVLCALGKLMPLRLEGYNLFEHDCSSRGSINQLHSGVNVNVFCLRQTYIKLLEI